MKRIVNILLYSTMFIPATALTYPVYNLVNRLGIYDTQSALILIYACSGIAVSFFIIKNYYINIPKEMEDAARIDGCGYIQTWRRVIFPMVRPGIMTAAVLAFLNNWNEYYWASLVILYNLFQNELQWIVFCNGGYYSSADCLILCV